MAWASIGQSPIPKTPVPLPIVVSAPVARRGNRVRLVVAGRAGDVEEAAESRVIEKRREILPAHGLGRVNVDHAGGGALDDVRVAHAVGRVAVDRFAIDPDRERRGRGLEGGGRLLGAFFRGGGFTVISYVVTP